MPARPGNKREFVQVSLRTRDFSSAKSLASLLNCNFYTFIIGVKTQRITRAEAQQFFNAIVSNEVERIEDERYVERQASTPQEWQNRYLNERARSLGLSKVAAMGTAAFLFDEDRAELSRTGFDEAGIALVEQHITELVQRCGSNFELETTRIAEKQLQRSDFTPDDTRALARIRLTGEARAISRSDRRHQTTPFIDLEAEIPEQVSRLSPVRSRPTREGYSDKLEELHSAYLNDVFPDVANPAEQKKVAKARRQNDAVLTQFYEAVEIKFLSELRQEDLHFYTTVLDRMPKIYGRSKEDRQLSLSELMERAEDLPEVEVGLSSNTINRNVTILRNFLKYARGRGARPNEVLEMGDLWRKDTADERAARLAFTDDDIRKLSQHPIWTGCRGPARRNSSGNVVIKDGCYWGPIIAAATGARREEIMGLSATDIVLDVPVPYILIEPNLARRLKNNSSKRAVPIHSRLLELGFLEYVHKMVADGERDLFPELRPDSPTETYGNVFYKPWKTALDQQLAEAANRKTFHSFRHRVITILRHNPEIDKASVKDLVGHQHEDVTDKIYRDPARLLMLQSIVEAIPVIF